MKENCINCKKEINKLIQKNFDEYIVGRYQCNNCKTKQHRYISELDLMIFFGINSISYALAIFIVFSIFDFVHNIIISSILIFIFFIGLLLFFKFIPIWIYNNPPLKSNWKNTVFTEEEKLISKRMKWQFIMFLLVSFMFGTSKEFTKFFYILIIAFIIIILIKIYLLYKRELKRISK